MFSGDLQIKSIEIHHLVPGVHEIGHEGRCGIIQYIFVIIVVMILKNADGKTLECIIFDHDFSPTYFLFRNIPQVL